MPCITLEFDPAKGPLIQLVIRPPASLVPASQTVADFEVITALIDTGADQTHLAKAVAQRLKLPVIGKSGMISAGGVHPIDRYMADLGIVFGGPTANVQDAFPLLDYTILEFAGAPHFDMLMGRDILCRGHFSMMGFNNRFMFCL